MGMAGVKRPGIDLCQRFYFIGPCYTIGVILLLSFCSMAHFGPILYGDEEDFRQPLLFMRVVFAQVVINLMFFVLRRKSNRFEWLLVREQKRSLPFSSYATLSGQQHIDEAFNSKFCSHCQCKVPKLCQHCSMCNHCVFKKDHHCFFLGGCVGFGNQRNFIVFLFWAFIGSSYALYLVATYFNTYQKDLWPLGWLKCLLPVYLSSQMFHMTFDLYEFALIVYMSVAFSSVIASFMFLMAQWMFVLTGKSMMGYFTLTDIFLGKEHPTLRERILIVFGPYWLLNFFIPLPWNNELDQTYRRALYSYYVKVL